MAQETIGRYLIADVLRREPLGRVALCQDPDTEQYVLGKELFLPRHLDAGRQQELTFRFRLALRVITEAQAPQFVPLVTWEPQTGSVSPEEPHFAVFELPAGETLADALREGRSFSPPEAFQIVDRCAAALQVLQENDLGPSAVDIRNVFLSGEGQPQWAELGFVHYLPEADESFAQRSSEGFLFQSPEELKRTVTTTASLVYSLGAVLYRLLTGDPPYPGDTAVAVLLAMAKKELEPLWNRMTEVPAGADELLAKALARESADRFTTVAEFRDALGLVMTAAEGQPGDEETPEDAREKPPAPGLKRLVRPAWKPLAAGGIVVVLALVVLLAVHKPWTSPPKRQPTAIQTPAPAAKSGEQATPTPPQLPPPPPAPVPSKSTLPPVRYQEPAGGTAPLRRRRPRPHRAQAAQQAGSPQPTSQPVGSTPPRHPAVAPPPTAPVPAPPAPVAGPPPTPSPSTNTAAPQGQPGTTPRVQLPPGVKQRF